MRRVQTFVHPPPPAITERPPSRDPSVLSVHRRRKPGQACRPRLSPTSTALFHSLWGRLLNSVATWFPNPSPPLVQPVDPRGPALAGANGGFIRRHGRATPKTTPVQSGLFHLFDRNRVRGSSTYSLVSIPPSREYARRPSRTHGRTRPVTRQSLAGVLGTGRLVLGKIHALCRGPFTQISPLRTRTRSCVALGSCGLQGWA